MLHSDQKILIRRTPRTALSTEPPEIRPPADERLAPLDEHCAWNSTCFPERVTTFCILPTIVGSLWCVQHAPSPEESTRLCRR